MELKKILPILKINFLVFLFSIIIIELIFGYWLKENHFSHHMRGKRLQKIEYNFDREYFSKKTIFKRDYYGFREDFEFNDLYDLSKIRIVFNGGSTGEEMFKPYEKTIVGNLNNFLKSENFKNKIYNASLAGKSSQGKINDFSVWFNKLDNFNPEIMIFYIGINDRKIPTKRFHDNNAQLNLQEKLIYLVSQNSIFWEKIKKIKDNYFTTKRDGYLLFDEEVSKKIQEGFLSYNQAKVKFDIPSFEEDIILKNYEKNLNILKKILKEKKIKPIFITQINYEGNGDRKLYFLNKTLKEFCEKNSFYIIKIDEKITEPINHLFFDEVHVNELGSLYIAKLIYSELKVFLKEIY
tara:strand:+ start:1922 stop:2974 length:1053 start_codon:yes stop_codon:yes gene_type:complete